MTSETEGLCEVRVEEGTEGPSSDKSPFPPEAAVAAAVRALANEEAASSASAAAAAEMTAENTMGGGGEEDRSVGRCVNAPLGFTLPGGPWSDELTTLANEART